MLNQKQKSEYDDSTLPNPKSMASGNNNPYFTPSGHNDIFKKN